MKMTETIEKKTVEQSIKLPIPCNGRMILEVIKEDALEHKKKTLGMENSILVLPESLVENSYVPCKKGIILTMAPDAFGKRYVKNYGDDGTHPEVGDVVMFIPNQSFKIDPEGRYHIIGDEHVIAYYKGE